MNILVIGATGGSGRAVCGALLDRGHRVTAVARHATALPSRPDLERVDGDATNAAFLDRVVPGHDAVIVTLGISEPTVRVRLRGAQGTPDDVRSRGTAAIVAAARRAGIGRIVVQSSYGVGETRNLLGLLDRFFLALFVRPQIIDSEIQEGVLRGSDLEWTIVQPVHLSDDRLGRSIPLDGRPHTAAQGIPSGCRPRPRRPRRGRHDDREDGLGVGVTGVKAEDERGRMLQHPPPLTSGCLRDVDQVDDEDEGLAAEEVTAGGAVCEVRRDDELAPTADLHARDAVLPALDQTAERELDALTAVPGRVEFFAGLVLDTGVVDGDGVAGLRLGRRHRR